MKLHGFNDSISKLEAIGLSECFKTYAENNCDEILEIGFNPNSGFVYIALEDGVSICSYLGRRVQYLVTNFETGEETFFDNYAQL